MLRFMICLIKIQWNHTHPACHPTIWRQTSPNILTDYRPSILAAAWVLSFVRRHSVSARLCVQRAKGCCLSCTKMKMPFGCLDLFSEKKMRPYCILGQKWSPATLKNMHALLQLNSRKTSRSMWFGNYTNHLWAACINDTQVTEEQETSLDWTLFRRGLPSTVCKQIPAGLHDMVTLKNIRLIARAFNLSVMPIMFEVLATLNICPI